MQFYRAVASKVVILITLEENKRKDPLIPTPLETVQ